jgi:hypothetical protein
LATPSAADGGGRPDVFEDHQAHIEAQPGEFEDLLLGEAPAVHGDLDAEDRA